MCCFLFYYVSAGVGTKIDPTLCRADRLVGQVRESYFLLVFFLNPYNAYNTYIQDCTDMKDAIYIAFYGLILYVYMCLHVRTYSVCFCICVCVYVCMYVCMCVCMYARMCVCIPYLSVLKPGSYTCRGSNICRVVQQNEGNKCLGPFKRRVSKLFN